jgi:glycopeptide antibiotics resistance protein
VSDQTLNAVVAIVLGSGLAVLLLAPVAAVQYRRDGRLGPGDLLVLLGAAVYALALWTYTLLPLPADDYRCVGRQTVPFATIGDIDPARAVDLLRDPAFLQVALNVALFVPLGFFVRLVLHRGIVVTTVLGLGISLAIECTQGTALWGLYPCPYRLFDVDDLLVNTLGALVGALLAAVLIGRHRPDARPLPTRVSTGRRWTGMVCDGLFVAVTGAGVALAWRAWQLYVVHDPVAEIDLGVQTALQWGVPGLVEALVVLLAGRTVGEWVVATRTVARRRWPTPVARVVKLLTGIGAYVALLLLDSPLGAAALVAFVAVSVAVVPFTAGRRGLSNALAGLALEVDDRT